MATSAVQHNGKQHRGAADEASFGDWLQSFEKSREEDLLGLSWQDWGQERGSQRRALRWLVKQGLDDCQRAGIVIDILEHLLSSFGLPPCDLQEELSEYCEEDLKDMALDNPRVFRFTADAQALLKRASSGFDSEPSPEELSQWIQQRYSKDTMVPEHSAQQSPKMGNWISDEFDSSCIRVLELPNALGTVLEGVLTRKECRRIVAETESAGYGYTSFPKAYRGNRRLQLDDSSGAMAEKIWQRVRAHVPAELTVDWMPEEDEYPTGIWKAIGCNKRFRFSKYFEGEGFAQHVDNMACFGSDCMSLLTINIYLNDLAPEQEGRTRFFSKRGGSEEPVAAAGGSAGSLVIFRQEGAVHDGEHLRHGLKYLMRTDVLYKKVQ